MKKVLLTGSSGFVGGNLLPLLQQRYCVHAPSRSQLDLRDGEAVKEYLRREQFDAVIHAASPTPVRSAQSDSYERLMHDMLSIYMNFYANQDAFGRMLYCGSGAEFDKRFPISQVKEEELGKTLPTDDYGLGKYLMNELARRSENVCNMRIFACYGPGEYDTKFIRHAIRCCLAGRSITIRQDCRFDYLYIEDYSRAVLHFVDTEPRFRDYNVCSGETVLLSQIAETVRRHFPGAPPVEIAQPGLNLDYTASCRRLAEETGFAPQISLEAGVEKMISWEKQQIPKD